mmetsp:Transcript_19199/g.23352  ORF Transcript_19199/g.23352 Transcript_19199/m.23352 type:complete len:140 (-) Transcript_19199:464-883(-)
MDPNARLQQATEDMIGRLAKNYLRPLHKKAFLCSANCCDKVNSHNEFQSCINSCQQGPTQAERLLSQELENFQKRIQRCAMDCSDKARDEMPTDPKLHTPELMAKLQGQVDSCVNKCVDSNIGSLKNIESRFTAAVKKL